MQKTAKKKMPGIEPSVSVEWDMFWRIRGEGVSKSNATNVDLEATFDFFRPPIEKLPCFVVGLVEPTVGFFGSPIGFERLTPY